MPRAPGQDRDPVGSTGSGPAGRGEKTGDGLVKASPKDEKRVGHAASGRRSEHEGALVLSPTRRRKWRGWQHFSRGVNHAVPTRATAHTPRGVKVATSALRVRSTDGARPGASGAPPQFDRRRRGGGTRRATRSPSWLRPGHDASARWLRGTSPQGLLVSDDTAALPGRASPDSTTWATARGSRAARMRRPTARRCTRSTSIPPIRATST